MPWKSNCTRVVRGLTVILFALGPTNAREKPLSSTALIGQVSSRGRNRKCVLLHLFRYGY
jgi:hypothetical protein